jgi:Pyridoxamine 5'-phosphate oxidase
MCMTAHEPIETTNLATLYGAQPLPWSRPRELLDDVGNFGPETPWFLGTVRPDGRPHAAGIGAVWHRDHLYFVSGPRTRKTRNVNEQPACTISGRLPGIDLVFEGEATRVVDAPTLESLVAVYSKGGWPARVEGDAFTAPYSAPSAGPPPWHVFRLDTRTVFGVASAEPFGATRWRF